MNEKDRCQLLMKVKRTLLETNSDDGKDFDFKHMNLMKELSINLATKIECYLYGQQGNEITKDYGKKYRDLTTGLRHELNVNLRQ